MKMLGISIFILLLTDAATGAEQVAKYTIQDPTWITCTNNDQCIIVPSPCGGQETINSKYRDQHNELIKKLAGAITCGAFVAASHPRTSARAMCQNGRCTFEETPGKENRAGKK